MDGTTQLRRLLAALEPARPLAETTVVRRHGAYRGYRELAAGWLRAVERGARITRIGTSRRGAPLFALELGPPTAAQLSLVIAGIHPIEWIGVEVGDALLARLIDEPPVDRRVLLVPLCNVDGFRRVEADLRAGRRRWRRTNAAGVDLNRNWPVGFRPHRPWHPSGRAAASEPEVAAILQHLETLCETASLEVAVSLHSIGRMLLLPYGHRWRRPEGFADAEATARAVAGRLRQRYRIRQVSHWVPGAFAHGVEIDTLQDRFGALALLVECSLGGVRARVPASWLAPFCWYNPPEVIGTAQAIAHALEPLVRGRSGADPGRWLRRRGDRAP